MGKRRFVIFCLLLSGALFLAVPPESWAQEAAAAEKSGNSGNALNRLIGISEQLSTLNERLRIELQDSRRNSGQLQTMLETSKRELAGLRRELEELKNELTLLKQEQALLRSSSAELLAEAENSRLESTALVTALRRAESSLTSLELSFAAYRETAKRRISSLERDKMLWKWSCIAAGVLAAGLGGTLLVTR